MKVWTCAKLQVVVIDSGDLPVRVLPREDALPIVEELLGALPALAGLRGRYACGHRSVLVRGRALGDDELDDEEPELITARLSDTVAPPRAGASTQSAPRTPVSATDPPSPNQGLVGRSRG